MCVCTITYMSSTSRTKINIFKKKLFCQGLVPIWQRICQGIFFWNFFCSSFSFFYYRIFFYLILRMMSWMVHSMLLLLYVMLLLMDLNVMISSCWRYLRVRTLRIVSIVGLVKLQRSKIEFRQRLESKKEKKALCVFTWGKRKRKEHRKNGTYLVIVLMDPMLKHSFMSWSIVTRWSTRGCGVSLRFCGLNSSTRTSSSSSWLYCGASHMM